MSHPVGQRRPPTRSRRWRPGSWSVLRRRFDRVVVDRTAEDVPVILAELTGEGSGRLLVYSALRRPARRRPRLRGTATRSRPSCATAPSTPAAPATTRPTSPPGCRRSTAGSTRERRPAAVHDSLGLRGRRGDRQPRAGARCSNATPTASRPPTASGRASSGARTAGQRSHWAAAGCSRSELSVAAARNRPARRLRAGPPLGAVDAHTGAREPRRRERRRRDRRLPR